MTTSPLPTPEDRRHECLPVSVDPVAPNRGSFSFKKAAARLPRLPYALIRFAAVIYFLFGISLLLLRYAVLPHIGDYKQNIERLASAALGNTVSVAAIDAAWAGLRPKLVLDQVVIHDPEGKPALTLPRVAATVSWWSVVAMDLRFHSLEIDRAELEASRDANGKLYIAGIPVDKGASGDGRGADWVLSQRQIRIRSGTLRWTDRQRAAPELVLDQVDILLRNDWLRHRFAMRARPPQSLAAPLDVRADFTHSPFNAKMADMGLWQGELYAHLRDANLAAWKPWVNYPFMLEQGRGTLRAWLKLDYARVANFTADLSLQDVRTQFSSDLPPLDLVRVRGRMSMKEPGNLGHRLGVPTYGARGHAVSLTDFSLQTTDGMRLPPSTLSMRHVPARDNLPESWEFQAGMVDLAGVVNLAQHFPLPAGQRHMLSSLAPRGILKNFSVQWQGSYPRLQSYRIEGDFVGLTLSPLAVSGSNANDPRTRPNISSQLHGTTGIATAAVTSQVDAPPLPGIENLSGRIDANERGGNLQLASEAFLLHAPGYLNQPSIPFDRLNMRAEWSVLEDRRLLIELHKFDFAIQGMKGSLSGKHLLPLDQRGAYPKLTGVLDLNGRLDGLELSKLHSYLPVRTAESLQHWLAGGLVAGTARDVRLRVRGDVAEFPFRTAQGGKKPAGEFSVAARIEQGKINYTPGETTLGSNAPLWPELDGIQGTISLDRTRMEIRAQSASTSNVTLSNVKAVVPDLLAKSATLQVEGKAVGPLQDFLRFANSSPVAGWIERFTEHSLGSGNAWLALKLQMPFAHPQDTVVRGELAFDNNDVNLFDGLPPLQGATGKLEFNEKGFTLHNLHAGFLGGRTTITGGTQRDGTMLVRAEGTLSADGVRRNYGMPITQRSTERVSGTARYSAIVRVHDKRSEVTVESNLQGLALDFPAPLRKTVNEALPLRFTLNSLPPASSGQSREDVRLTLGSAIVARYERQRAVESSAVWQVMRGAIGVNMPATLPDSGVIINANMRSLDLDAWQRALNSLGAPQSGKVSAFGANGPASGPSVAQYLNPDVLAARTDTLFVMGRRLDDVVVGASSEGDTWQANIDSRQASGYLTWRQSQSGEGLGRVTARLTSLVIPESTASRVDALIEGDDASIQMPAIDIVAENFELFGKKFGQLELIAYNPRGERGREWRIGKLAIANADGDLRASGKWTSINGQSQSSLDYVLNIADAGNLLERFGFPEVLRGGKGKMEGNLSWKGKPYAFDIPSLSGQFQLNMASGQFLKADPGAAKLIGVLSLQSLPRRFALDFRDVFSEGMAFDTINSTVNIAQGVAHTDNFKMRGVAATVLLDGSADIARETQDLRVVVIPEINAGAASVVYGLAVNPVIGVGSFLAQLFLREPLMKALTFELKVSGPWKDPAVTKLQRSQAKPETQYAGGSEG